MTADYLGYFDNLQSWLDDGSIVNILHTGSILGQARLKQKQGFPATKYQHSFLVGALLNEFDASTLPMMNNGVLFPLVDDLQWKPGVVAHVLAGHLQVNLFWELLPLPWPHHITQISVVYSNTGGEFKA